MAPGKPWNGDDADHNNRCHERWIKQRNRDTADPGYREPWYDEQCGRCRFWIPLDGELGRDYGACTNPASSFDGQVRRMCRLRQPRRRLLWMTSSSKLKIV